MRIAILILLATVSLALGRTVQFTGVITSVADTTLPLQVGQPFSAHLIFNNTTHVVTRTNITVGILHFSYPAETPPRMSFTFQNDPCKPEAVSYQVSQSGPSHLTLQLFGQAGCCVMPSLDTFVINEWRFFLQGQTIGVLTEIPVIQ